MTRLAIFGDSFVDPMWKLQQYDWTWPNRLAQDYVTSNYGHIGTGPDYALEHLLQYIEEHTAEQLNNTCLIFVCSDPHRLNLKDFWKENRNQVDLLRVADRSMPHPKYMFARDIVRHLMVPGWSSKESFKILNTVSNLSHQFKRVLFWPAIDPYPIYMNMIQLATNLQLVQPSLFTISAASDIKSSGMDDMRVNHFDPPYHQILYEEMHSWIESGTVINTQRLIPTPNA